MSVPTKARPIRGAVRVLIGERKPRLFLLPKSTAKSVMDLLGPYAHDDEERVVSAADVLADEYARAGKAATVLRGYRTRDGLTQQRLAVLLGCTQGDVSAMENARRPIGRAMARKLARIFETDYRVFL